MANIVFNISKGRVNELYRRVESNDPTNAAFILVPIELAGLEADAVMLDYDDLAAILAAANNEQTTMGRKVLTSVELAAFPAPDDVNNRYETALPTTIWPGATGNEIAKILVCYDEDTTTSTDADIVPMTLFDFAIVPDGSDVEMTTGNFFRAG